MKRYQIVSLGEVLWDLFPEGPRFGGAPANFACHAAILGGEVTMVSAVGDDPRGREAIEILAGFGVDTSLMAVVPDAPTGTVGIEIDENRKHAFTIHEGSAWDQLAWTSDLAGRIETAGAICFGTLGQRADLSRATIRRALAVAEAAGIPRVLDVNLRAPFFDDEMIRVSVQQASILKLADDEIAQVAAACGIVARDDLPSVLREILRRFDLDHVVMTRGAEGALLVSPDDVVDQPGIPTKVVDTVGAGDSFTAAFVLGLLRGEPAETILRTACETAAAVCSQAGAVPKRPR